MLHSNMEKRNERQREHCIIKKNILAIRCNQSVGKYESTMDCLFWLTEQLFVTIIKMMWLSLCFDCVLMLRRSKAKEMSFTTSQRWTFLCRSPFDQYPSKSDNQHLYLIYHCLGLMPICLAKRLDVWFVHNRNSHGGSLFFFRQVVSRLRVPSLVLKEIQRRNWLFSRYFQLWARTSVLKVSRLSWARIRRISTISGRRRITFRVF